jgi:hypothetical protein
VLIDVLSMIEHRRSVESRRYAIFFDGHFFLVQIFVIRIFPVMENIGAPCGCPSFSRILRKGWVMGIISTP